MPYIYDARASKHSFQLSKVLSFVGDVASSTVWKNKKDILSCWDALRDAMSQVITQANVLLPITMETQNIIKSTLHCLTSIVSSFSTPSSQWCRTMGYAS